MKLLIIPERTKSLVHAVIGIKTGWRNEKAGKRGITHFLEHAIFLGNKDYPSPDSEVAKYGVSLEGMNIPEHTLFFFTSSKEDFNKIFSLFLSLIFHPEFHEDKLKKEKEENIITAVNKEVDFAPWELAYEWARNLVFDWDFMLGAGTEEDIELLTKKDLATWHKRYYHALNSFIVIHGDIQENKVAKLIESTGIPLSGEVPSLNEIHWDRKGIFIKKEGMKNVEIVYGFKLPQYDIKWEVLQVILGNYPISRLWENKFSKFTYMVNSRLEWTTSGGGFFLYFGATSVNNSHEIDKNLWLLIEDLEIDEEKLEFAKKIKSLEILKMEEGGEQGLLKFLSSNLFLKYKNFEEMVRRINQTEKEEVLSLAKKFLNKENVVKVTVGTEK